MMRRILNRAKSFFFFKFSSFKETKKKGKKNYYTFPYQVFKGLKYHSYVNYTLPWERFWEKLASEMKKKKFKKVKAPMGFRNRKYNSKKKHPRKYTS